MPATCGRGSGAPSPAIVAAPNRLPTPHAYVCLVSETEGHAATSLKNTKDQTATRIAKYHHHSIHNLYANSPLHCLSDPIIIT